jgi:hypothetical protein
VSCLLVLQGSAAYTSILPRIPSGTSSSRLHLKVPDSGEADKEPLLSSRKPHKLANGRGTFLGFRKVHDFKSIARASTASALIPEGGLSPCVIRVLGVGGGGCNAVSHLVRWLVHVY